MIHRLTTLALAFLLASSAPAQTSYPMVMGINPVAVQIGQTTECEVSARYNLNGAYQVFVTGTGVVGEVGTSNGARPRGSRRRGGKLRVRFKVAQDALPGVRDVRLATPLGASTLGQIVVVRDPVVREAANNDTMPTAQPIKLPATVCGAIEKPEDVDFYKFHVEAGTALTFHVQAQRLENRIHDLQEHVDPILTLRNATGSVLAVNDNYFAGDPLLHHRFAAAGDYFLEIRDVRYGGNPDWLYSIEINDRPFVTNVFPSRVTPGKTTRVKLIGYNLPTDPMASITLPADAPEGLQWTVLRLGNGQVTNTVPVVVSRLPEVVEAPGDNNTPAQAQKIAVPSGVSGCIEREGDVDCYAFDAKAGERFSFAVVAHRHQSPLDSYLRILNDKGQPLIENDDGNDRYIHADSRIENWAAPANGKYVIEIRDVHLRGGPTFVYFLNVTRSEPAISLELDTDKTILAPGITGVIYARVTRHNGFTGEVQLAIDGLPPGVTATCGKILATGQDGCIVLQAAPNAPKAAANVRVTGKATYKPDKGKPGPLTATARPLQEIYMPGGGRFHYPVEMHTVSIGDPLDLLAVRLNPTSVTLKPGESKKVEVTVERRAGFNQNVTIELVYQHLGQIFGDSLPPGVTVDDKASQTLLTGTQTKGYVTLKAAPDAKPVQDQLVPVMGHVSINFVMKLTYAAPLRITITK
jgi:hypothetical protein